MRWTGWAVLLILLLAGAGLYPARSASFDCAKASHPLEKIICQTPSLSALDSAVAADYRAKLAMLFDKIGFRGQQRDWQQLLRTKCAKGCKASDVEADYRVQQQSIASFDEEIYDASYKTADVSTLTLHHVDATRFDFSIVRDLDGKTLCALPANDGEAGAIATLTSPVKASWTAGACTIDFTLTRDASGSVTRIDAAASPGCQHYCPAKRYGLSDVYLPANNWVASNQ